MLADVLSVHLAEAFKGRKMTLSGAALEIFWITSRYLTYIAAFESRISAVCFSSIAASTSALLLISLLSPSLRCLAVAAISSCVSLFSAMSLKKISSTRVPLLDG